jgi:hypothetical protein
MKAASLQADELFREVDEELQREKLLRYWKRFGNLFLAAVLLVVLATAGWVGWRNWQARQRQAEAVRFADAEALVARQDFKGAAAAFSSLGQNADHGFSALARLRAAQADVAAGDVPSAVASLDALAADSSVDPLLRDLATLQAALLTIDTAPPADLRAKLEPIAVAGKPWHYEARELLAIAAIRAGDDAQAREILGALTEDAGAPDNLRRRAGELRSALPGRAAGS